MTEQPEFVRIHKCEVRQPLINLIEMTLIENSRVPYPIAMVILNDPMCMLSWFDRDDVDMPISREMAKKWYSSRYSHHYIIGKAGVTDIDGVLYPEDPIPANINWVFVRFFGEGADPGLYHLYQRTSTINRASKIQIGGKSVYSHAFKLLGEGQ